MPRSSLSKAMVDAWLAGTARQSLWNLLSDAVIDRAVPLAVQSPGAGFDSANDPRPDNDSHDTTATTGRKAAMALRRVSMFIPPGTPAPGAHHSSGPVRPSGPAFRRRAARR